MRGSEASSAGGVRQGASPACGQGASVWVGWAAVRSSEGTWCGLDIGRAVLCWKAMGVRACGGSLRGCRLAAGTAFAVCFLLGSDPLQCPP